VARTEGIVVGRSQVCRILPASAWSPGGHRIKAELDYSRAPENTRWHIFREATLTRRPFANRYDIEHATPLATNQLNSRTNPWIRGRRAPPTRRLRRRYVYTV
jgi:hypothetical protein